MTTPTNARQTSERERLAEWLERWATEMDMGRKPDVKDNRRIAAAQLRADERIDAEIAALRAENEALRTVTDEYLRAIEVNTGIRSDHARIAISEFIRSKEARRG